jgi:hypothetical protein
MENKLVALLQELGVSHQDALLLVQFAFAPLPLPPPLLLFGVPLLPAPAPPDCATLTSTSDQTVPPSISGNVLCPPLALSMPPPVPFFLPLPLHPALAWHCQVHLAKGVGA